MHKFRAIVSIALHRTTIASSLQVGLVVGVLLNFINQWGAIISMQFAAINYPKALLTFAVPYLVSTYATIKAKMP